MRIKAKSVLVHPCAVFRTGARAFKDCRSIKLMMVEAKRSPPIHQRSRLIGRTRRFPVSSRRGFIRLSGKGNFPNPGLPGQAAGVSGCSTAAPWWVPQAGGDPERLPDHSPYFPLPVQVRFNRASVTIQDLSDHASVRRFEGDAADSLDYSLRPNPICARPTIASSRRIPRDFLGRHPVIAKRSWVIGSTSSVPGGGV